MTNETHGEITEKHHFTIKLSDEGLEDLIGFSSQVTVETDRFVATVEPPEEIEDRTKKSVIKRLVELL